MRRDIFEARGYVYPVVEEMDVVLDVQRPHGAEVVFVPGVVVTYDLGHVGSTVPVFARMQRAEVVIAASRELVVGQVGGCLKAVTENGAIIAVEMIVGSRIGADRRAACRAEAISLR